MRRLLALRDARIYIAGQSFSVIGDSALWLAMGIWVKILTGSNSAAGLTFFAFTSGCLTAPLSGVIVDRLRRRPLLIAANLGGAALVCALLLVHGRGQVWLIYAVMFGYGAANSLITAAQTALLTDLVPGELLGEANAALQMASQGLRLITPLLGAGLLAWSGARPVILLDAGTFGVAAAAVLALRLRERRRGRAAARWRAEFTAGIRHIARTPGLRRPLVACLIAVTAFGFFETVPFAVVGQGLHRSPEFLGVLISLQGAGALAGGVLAAPVMRRASERALMAGGLAACAAAALLMITGSLPLVLTAAAAIGLCVVWINVGAITLIQRRTPGALLGRVDATLEFAIVVPQAVSIAAGAALIAAVSYRVLLVAMAAVIGFAAGYLAAGRERASGQTGATAPQQADSMPRESAGTL
ncbi:MAG TPA: MFS transporter [Streptosporangiaceae bacterium]|nr:MFS transporter [Streptosporangiaceae bacterium]